MIYWSLCVIQLLTHCNVPQVFQKLIKIRRGEAGSASSEVDEASRVEVKLALSFNLSIKPSTSNMIATRITRRIQPLANRHLLQRGRNSTYQPPEPPQSSNRHRTFYRTFGRPLGKNFLIAVVTFQVIYWSWLKLESLDTKEEKNEEIQSLESELKSLTKGKSPS